MLRRSTPQIDSAELARLVQDVVDPVLGHSLGSLEMIGALDQHGATVRVVVTVPVGGYPSERELNSAIAQACAQAGVVEVEVAFEVMADDGRAALGRRLRALDGGNGPTTTPAPGRAPQGAPARANPFSARQSRTRVLAIASGKGGVGKSSVTVNLAVALARAGHRVGLLDADIYGFSVPRMIGVPYAPVVLGETIVPPLAHGVACMSMGFFVDEDKAVAWRGPMLHKALEQFLVDVYWGPIDFLLVDMPPGTGDVALSVAQQLPTAEVYVVTTPQPSAERVAQRSGALGKQLRMSIRGVIENMSFFTGDDGVRYEIFGSGGGQVLAESFGVPLLTQIPLVLAMRVGADNGEPIAVAEPDSELAGVFDELAAQIAQLGPARVYRSELSVS